MKNIPSAGTIIEFRIFEQGGGWGEWHGRAVFYGYDPVQEFMTRNRPELQNVDCNHGFSLGKTNEDGAPEPSGICMVTHSQGVYCVEYRPKSLKPEEMPSAL